MGLRSAAAGAQPVTDIKSAAGGAQSTAWSIVLLLALILFGGAAMRTVFGPLQEAAKLDLGLTDIAISYVQGLAVGAPVALISLPVAWVVDHGNRVRLLIALLAICVIGTFWTAFAGSFVTLFMARVLSGLGADLRDRGHHLAHGGLLRARSSRTRDRHPGSGHLCRKRCRLRVSGGILLAVLAKHPVAFLGTLAPWRGTHLLIGLAGMALLFPLFLLREPQRHEQQHIVAALGPSLRALWAKRRFLLPLFVGQLCVGMADNAAASGRRRC